METMHVQYIEVVLAVSGGPMLVRCGGHSGEMLQAVLRALMGRRRCRVERLTSAFTPGAQGQLSA